MSKMQFPQITCKIASKCSFLLDLEQFSSIFCDPLHPFLLSVVDQ